MNQPLRILHLEDDPLDARLDEPLSAIMTAMEQLMRGRTTFMIAHRLSTLDLCDVRVDIEYGQIMSISNQFIEPCPLAMIEPKRLRNSLTITPESIPFGARTAVTVGMTNHSVGAQACSRGRRCQTGRPGG